MEIKDVRSYEDAVRCLEDKFSEIDEGNLSSEKLKELVKYFYPLIDNEVPNLNIGTRTWVMYHIINKLKDKSEQFADELEIYGKELKIGGCYKKISERFGFDLSRLENFELQLLASEVNQQARSNKKLKEGLMEKLERNLGEKYKMFNDILNSFENNELEN